MGRQSHNLDLSIQGDTLFHIVMSPFEFLEGAVVEGYQSIIPSAYIGAMEIPVSYVNDMPSILGEPDLMKTLQRMPGVQSGMAGFSGLHVRGGGAEENLVLLDGVSLYNVSHMLGLFSSFTPEAIKQVTLYKGFFPAKYGGRTSSVIDVRTNDGNVKRLGGTVSVGLINSRVHIEGPLVSDKTSFSISARGTNTLAMAPLARGSQFPYLYYFYDLSGKLTHRFGDSDRLNSGDRTLGSLGDSSSSFFNNKENLFTDVLFRNGDYSLHFYTKERFMLKPREMVTGDVFVAYNKAIIRLFAITREEYLYLTGYQFIHSLESGTYLTDEYIFYSNVNGGLGFVAVNSAADYEIDLSSYRYDADSY